MKGRAGGKRRRSRSASPHSASSDSYSRSPSRSPSPPRRFKSRRGRGRGRGRSRSYSYSPSTSRSRSRRSSSDEEGALPRAAKSAVPLPGANTMMWPPMLFLQGGCSSECCLGHAQAGKIRMHPAAARSKPQRCQRVRTISLRWRLFLYKPRHPGNGNIRDIMILSSSWSDQQIASPPLHQNGCILVSGVARKGAIAFKQRERQLLDQVAAAKEELAAREAALARERSEKEALQQRAAFMKDKLQEVAERSKARASMLVRLLAAAKKAQDLKAMLQVNNLNFKFLHLGERRLRCNI